MKDPSSFLGLTWLLRVKYLSPKSLAKLERKQKGNGYILAQAQYTCEACGCRDPRFYRDGIYVEKWRRKHRRGETESPCESSVHHIFARASKKKRGFVRPHPELKNIDANKICLCKKCHRELEKEIQKLKVLDFERLPHLVDFIIRKRVEARAVVMLRSLTEAEMGEVASN